jgi:Flp pilus assembly protein TadG
VSKSLIGFSLRHRKGWKSGAATVELAITAPLLIVLVLGVADYGALMNSAASLEGATRALAEYARNAPACGGGLTVACTTGINNLASTLQANNSSLSSATFTPSAQCTCVNNTAKVCPAAGGANPCASPPVPINPATGTADSRLLQYIQIQATQSINPLVPYGTYTAAKPLTAQTTTRIQ